MSIERELFEKEYCKVQMIADKGDTFEQYPNGDYIRHSLQLAWLMWQASANREGYKLVPVDLPSNTSDDIWDNLLNNKITVNSDGDGFIPVCDFDLDVVYKAMIGACE